MTFLNISFLLIHGSPTIIIISALTLMTFRSEAQSLHYDFGNSQGAHSSGESITFLPAPVVGSARIRIGTQGGSAQLVNPGNPHLGTGTELAIEAATGASVNKFSMYDLPRSQTVTIRFECAINDQQGEWYFFIGSGSTFTGNTTFSGVQTFTGLKWVVGSTGVITLSLREGNVWKTLAAVVAPDSLLRFEMYCNNRANSEAYSYYGNESVAAHSTDIWLNGIRIADDALKAGILDSSSINAFMFYGASSPDNGCTISIDEITWSTSIAQQPLPVELSVFTASRRGRDIELYWVTETELNNFGFSIERRTTGSDTSWHERAFIQGAGNSYAPKQYHYRDSSVSAALPWEYRLRQIDRDGSVEYSRVKFLPAVMTAHGHSVEAPFPNPGREQTHFSFTLITPARVRLRLYSSSGTRVYDVPTPRFLPAGRHVFVYRCADLPRGLYYCRYDIDEQTSMQPLFLL